MDEELENAIILHNLKFRFFKGRENKEMYFSLSSKDLADLLEVIKRAELKEKKIRTALSKNLFLVNVKRND
jgi:hypothetical protein